MCVQRIYFLLIFMTKIFIYMLQIRCALYEKKSFKITFGEMYARILATDYERYGYLSFCNELAYTETN